MKSFKSLSFALIALTTLAACGAGNGGSSASSNNPQTQNPIPGQPGQPGPVAQGTLSMIPSMNFRCGPNCVRIKRSSWFTRTSSMQGKRFDIVILPNSVPSCHDWRNLYIGSEIAIQRPKIRSCLQYGGNYGVNCSTVVSRQTGEWQRPTGERVSQIPAGQYLVCASVDANGDRILNDDEFYSETRIVVQAQMQPQYPVQVQGQYPNQQPIYPQNTSIMQYQAPLELAPASTHWDGSSPIYY